MKNLNEYMTVLLTESEESIKDEKAFREYAEAKLKEVFGDEYDEDKAKEMIDGILADNKELVDAGDWGALVGVLNKGVVKESLVEEAFVDAPFSKLFKKSTKFGKAVSIVLPAGLDMKLEEKLNEIVGIDGTPVEEGHVWDVDADEFWKKFVK